MSPSWNDQLADAFSILLGHPLSDHDPQAEYAAYYSGNFLSESEFNREPVWLEPEALSGEAVLDDTPFLLYDQGEPAIELSAAGSLFEIWDPDGRLPPLCTPTSPRRTSAPRTPAPG
ncbi:hypothetical protein ACFQ9X_27830 [Catenulispora yoronensis]